MTCNITIMSTHNDLDEVQYYETEFGVWTCKYAQNTMIFERINTNMIAFDWSTIMIDPCEDS